MLWFPVTFLRPYPTTFPQIPLFPASLASLLLLFTKTRHASTSGSFLWLSLLPGILFPQVFAWLISSSSSVWSNVSSSVRHTFRLLYSKLQCALHFTLPNTPNILYLACSFSVFTALPTHFITYLIIVSIFYCLSPPTRMQALWG